MAENPLDTLALRDVKYGDKTTPERQAKVARQLLAANRIYEALDLLLLAGDEKGIREIATRALTEGVPALLLMLKRAGRNPARKEWMEAGEAAFGAGRWREAFRCFLEAGDEAALARVRERLPGYDIYTPTGK